MRVLYITPFFPPVIGGVETVVNETCAALVAAGHEAAVLTSPAPGSPARERRGSVDVHRESFLAVPPTGRVDPREFGWGTAVDRFREVLETVGPDVVHLHNYHMRQYALFLFPLFSALDPAATPPFITIHNTTDDPFAHYLLAYLPFAAVLALTNRSALDLLRGGVPASRVRVIPNLIDVERFQGADGAAVRDRLGLGDEPLILFPSRLVGREGNPVYGEREGKGLDVLLRALPLVRRELPRVKLLLLGNDPLYPHVLARTRRAIAELAGVFGVGDALLYLDGPLPQEAIPEVFAAADLVVSLGPTECFGMVFLEGMAAGKPVVGVNSAESGVPEVVGGGGGGLLVPPNDPWSTARAIVDILGKPGLAAELGRRGLRWVRSRYDAEVVLPRLLEVYGVAPGAAAPEVVAAPSPKAGARGRGT